VDYLLDPWGEEFTRWVEEFEGQPDRPRLSADIETSDKDEDEGESDLESGYEGLSPIDRISFSYRPFTGVSVPWQMPWLVGIKRLLASQNDKLFHNEAFDVPRLRAAGCAVNGVVHDSMVAWHLLHSDLPKGLGFIATFLCPGQKMWKHLSHVQPAFYNTIDSDVANRCMMRIEEELHKHGLWHLYEEHVLKFNIVRAKMSQNGMPIDLGKRKAAALQLGALYDQYQSEMQVVVPEEVKQVSPKNGYVRPPADTTGMRVISVKTEVKRCGNCGQLSPDAQHRKVFKKKSNPCGGAEVSVQTEAVDRWAKVEPFVPSQKQVIRYQQFRHHPLVMTGKRGQDQRPTTNEKALKQLMGKYPGDKLYPLILDYREVERLGANYIGWWDEEQGLVVGGMPTDASGLVHTTFTDNPSTWRLSSVSPNLQNCYDDQTQVLTPTGWKRFQDLLVTDTVAQAEENGAIRFVAPQDYISREVHGPMVHIQGEYVDLLVTPEHHMVSWMRKSGELERSTAASWLARWGGTHVIDRRMRRGGRLVGGRKLTALERQQLEQAIATQAEGYVRYDTKKIEVAVKSARKRKQLMAIFPNVRIRKDDAVAWVAPEDVEFWLELPSKVFKIEQLLKLCAEDLDWFLSRIMVWDGDSTRSCTFAQHKKRQKAVEAVQLAAVLSGHSTSWYHHPRNELEVVNVHRSAERWASRLTITSEFYHGQVYCVRVPSGMLLVRRDNDIIVCGNCPRGDDAGIQLLVKGMFVAPSGQLIGGRDFSGIEAVLVGYLANSQRYTRLAKLGVHAFFASHLLGRPADLSWSDSDLKAYLKQIKREAKGTLIGSDDLYNTAKRVIHLSNYRGTPRRMHDEYPKTFPTIKEAAKYQGLYYDLFSEIPAWHKSLCASVGKSTWVRTPFGYIMRFYAVQDWERGPDGKWDWSFGDDAKRLIACVPQNTASAILKDASNRLFFGYEQVREWLRLFIHDELLWICPEGDMEEMLALTKLEMERPIQCLPLDPSWGMGEYLAIGTEAKVGASWDSCKEVKE
jgi:hypothetical protein